MLNFKSRSVRRGTVFGVPAALAIGAALWIRPAARDAVSVGRGAVSSHAVSKAGPPWLYGRADARGTHGSHVGRVGGSQRLDDLVARPPSPHVEQGRHAERKRLTQIGRGAVRQMNV